VQKFVRFLTKQHKVEGKKYQVAQDLSGFDRIPEPPKVEKK
jgi:hypothetical protein